MKINLSIPLQINLQIDPEDIESAYAVQALASGAASLIGSSSGSLGSEASMQALAPEYILEASEFRPGYHYYLESAAHFEGAHRVVYLKRESQKEALASLAFFDLMDMQYWMLREGDLNAFITKAGTRYRATTVDTLEAAIREGEVSEGWRAKLIGLPKL